MVYKSSPWAGDARHRAERRFRRAVGVNIDRIIAFTFLLGSAIGAVAGVMVVLIRSWHYFMDHAGLRLSPQCLAHRTSRARCGGTPVASIGPRPRLIGDLTGACSAALPHFRVPGLVLVLAASSGSWPTHGERA